MYEQFFGLRERPFDLTPNPRFLVMTEVHGEVLSTLEYAIASQKGLTLLVGEAGLGQDDADPCAPSSGSRPGFIACICTIRR